VLRQANCELALRTPGRGLYELTQDVALFVKNSGITTGLITLHVRHTSASLLIQENADPGARREVERFFARLVNDSDPAFQHASKASDDMPAHIRTALGCVNLNIPIAHGELALGTRQGIFLWEHRRAAQARRVVLHVIGE